MPEACCLPEALQDHPWHSLVVMVWAQPLQEQLLPQLAWQWHCLESQLAAPEQLLGSMNSYLWLQLLDCVSQMQ